MPGEGSMSTRHLRSIRLLILALGAAPIHFAHADRNDFGDELLAFFLWV